MSVTKRISGNLLITNKEALNYDVTISTRTLYVDGNLVVGGNSSVVTKTDTEITDNTITLNKGESGNGVTLGTSGIEVDRGNYDNVGLRFNEEYARWELTNDGTIWGNITSGSTSAIANIYGDSSPRISANLEITDKTIYDTIANVEIRANTSAMGGTGVYTNPIGAVDQKKELITKNRALVYSIIL